jgi:hypothetical protein
MQEIKAIWINGQILPSGPVDWPEGSELVVGLASSARPKIGMDECEWRDGPEAIAAYEQWLPTIEPLEFSEEEADRLEQFQKQFRQFNLDAVARQMAAGEQP